ncbi:hypothetical protein EDB84DRAFT_1475305 [Lactarius hengduanensis]|nr:hypothetical protein EDB84DRAFT_1475305 [Lactarius hengduanensis]
MFVAGVRKFSVRFLSLHGHSFPTPHYQRRQAESSISTYFLTFAPKCLDSGPRHCFRCVSAIRPTIYVPWPSVRGATGIGKAKHFNACANFGDKMSVVLVAGWGLCVALPCSRALSLRAFILQSLPLLLWERAHATYYGPMPLSSDSRMSVRDEICLSSPTFKCELRNAVSMEPGAGLRTTTGTTL